jgi:hypothetical protein
MGILVDYIHTFVSFTRKVQVGGYVAYISDAALKNILQFVLLYSLVRQVVHCAR